MPSAPSHPAPDAPSRRVDGSMSLLVDMMANTLDEAYAERAARKAEQPRPGDDQPAPPPRRRWTTVVGLVLLGLVTGTAVAQVRARQNDTTGLRAGLAAEVQERTAETDALARQAERLREDLAATQAEVLGADAAGRAAAQRLISLGLASATVPVQGPGVVVRLDDAPPDRSGAETVLRGGTPVDGRVQDRDVQDVVNGLWVAGAEAISVNGVRLTALTAIRSAGEAILVDFRLLSPPYVVRAIGAPAELELELLDGPTGRRLSTYVSLYGLRFEVRRDDSLSLPGASTPDLRVTRPEEGR